MAEPKFVAKPGQIDFTNARYCPVVNTVVTKDGKILLVQRSEGMRLYSGYWNGISGFLDDGQDIKEKIHEEILDELSISKTDVKSLKIGQVLLQDAPDIGKTWLVVPALATIKTEKYTLDWEAIKAGWFLPAEAKKLKLLPGFEQVLAQFFP